MPITSSAKKALRASKNKRVFNVARQEAVREVQKNIKKLLASGKVSEATKLISSAYQAIDKAVKRGVLKANTAARKKSRLVASIKRSSQIS